MIPLYHFVAGKIREECHNLERVIRAAERSIAGAQRHPEDQDVYINSAALNLHSFYSGLEKVFLLIAEQVDGTVPRGSHWHRDLLDQMSYDFPRIRPGILSPETREHLQEYRSFRHVVRNVYTYNLDPERVQDLVRRLPSVWSAVKADLEGFLSFLETAAQADVEG